MFFVGAQMGGAATSMRNFEPRWSQLRGRYCRAHLFKRRRTRRR